ncbi:MAG TPA: nickel pincer cofactor biosynthesis protein LarB [Syntrophomonadaceae bacterium]|nr:nickel pincer cofactor biosynthesis protein LarB [Syntrophomonadaceae bacterium]
MDRMQLLNLFEQVKRGETDPQEACERIGTLPYEDLGFARVDHHRSLRDHFPEVVFCQGKSLQQVVAIVRELAGQNQGILATRADPAMYLALKDQVSDLQYNEMARVIFRVDQQKETRGRVLVLSAGTADIPVAEEAATCLEVMGITVDRAFDVGVAGLHRLADVLPRINQAQVVIVVAGMEGALASVVGGFTYRPVIAVPTSVGYGASFGGLAALLAMLNSCAAGVAVVNIDNGYGAAAMASAILGTNHG